MTEFKYRPRGGSGGGGGSPYFIDPVDTFADLPPTAPEGTLVLVIDEDALYERRGGAWVLFVDPATIQQGIDDAQDAADAAQGDIDAHVADLSNPHNVTAAQVGLGNVENAAASTLYVPLAQKGANNGVATLGAGGKIPSAQLPPVAITETFVVASQATQTALTAQVGDVAVRTDEDKSYILQSEPASTFSNWVLLRTPADAVLSVNGQTGAVSLDTDDIPEGTSQYFTVERAQDAAGAMFNASSTISAIYDDSGNQVYIDLVQGGVNRNSSGGGALTIANGGTGQTTKTNAFDALAPTSAKGDLIAYNGTDNVRVAAGVNGYALKANSATPEGLSYGPVAVYEGEKNYVPDPYSVGGTWVQGTSTITTTTTLAQLPEPSYGSAVELTGIGYSTIWPRQIDPVDLNKSLKLSFAALYAGAPTEFEIQIRSYATIGDRNADVNSFSAGNLLPVTIYQRGSNNLFSFTSDSNPWLNVRLVKTAATALFMSSVLVGPGQLQSVPAVTDWMDYVPTFGSSFTTPTAPVVTYAKYAIVAGTIFLDVRFASGTTTGNALQVSLPNNWTIGGTANSASRGSWQVDNSASTQVKAGTILSTAGNNFVQFAMQDTATGNNPFVAISANVAFTSVTGRLLSFTARVPIAELAGKQIAVGPGSTVEFASNNGSGGTAANSSYTTGSVVGNRGSVFPAVNSTTVNTQTVYRVDFSAPIQDGDKLLLEYQPVGAIGWTPAAGSMFDFEENGAGGTFYRYGFRVERGPGLPDNSVVVVFGNGGSRQTGNAGAAGEAWSAVAGLGWRWRVRKESAGSAAGIQTAGANVDGVNKKPRYQFKRLTSNIATNGAAVFSFNNLTVGKTYRFTLNSTVTRGAAGGNASVLAVHDGNNLLFTALDAVTGSQPERLSAGGNVIFVATATSITCTAVLAGAGSTVIGTATGNHTFGMLEELAHYEATTDWT